MIKYRNGIPYNAEDNDAEVSYLLDSDFGKTLLVLYTELDQTVPQFNREQRRQVVAAMIQAMLVEEGKIFKHLALPVFVL